MRTGVRQVLTDEKHNAIQLYQGSPAFPGLRTPARARLVLPQRLRHVQQGSLRGLGQPASQPTLASDYGVWEPSRQTLPPGATAPGQ